MLRKYTQTETDHSKAASLVSKTSIVVPPASSGDTIRERLLGRLDESVSRKLTLISAPAGYGKSTLVRTWVHTRGTKAAWVSLDSGDRSASRFWTTIAAALLVEYPAMSKTMQDRMPPGESNIDTLISAILELVSMLSEPCVLVLDDYHLVANPLIHDSMSAFLEHASSSVHVILISRTIPPLPLSRLRVSKQLSQFHTEDLRFTIEEAEELQRLTLKNPLAAEELVLLGEKTEGWAAGLLLAFMSLQHRQDAVAYIKAFSGSHRYIFDYLADEVLGRLDERLLDFLLLTSIADRFTAELANAITANQDAHALLDRLEKSHLFLIPLDDSRVWYRYHHLLTEALRSRLQVKKDAGALSELHLRAARWFDQKQAYEEAIRHALQAGDFNWAAERIERHLPMLVKNGHESEMMAWLAQIPLVYVVARPDLFYYQAGTLALTGRVQEADSLLNDALAALGEQQRDLSVEASQEMTMRMGMYRASIAFYKGDIDAFVELLDRHREGLRLFASIVKVVNLGEALLYRGPIGFGGRLNKMAALSAKVSDSEERREAIHYALQGHGLVFLADLYYERNALDKVTPLLEIALSAQATPSGLGVWVPAIILQSKLLVARGDMQGAEHSLQNAMKELNQLHVPHWRMLLEAQMVRLKLSQSKADEGTRWADRYPVLAHETASVDREYAHVTLARIWLMQGKTDIAIRKLRQAEKAAFRADRLGSRIEIGLLLAIAYDLQGKPSSSTEALDQVLRLAEPEGYVRLFLDEGQVVRRLLTDRLATGLASGIRQYVGKLLTSFEAELGTHAAESRADLRAEVDSLTSRELDILKCMADGLSNSEIASHLFLSLGTVKRYSHHIYQKLNVKNRVQAITKAKGQRLI
ncbi:LuxR C-terminal-related transcriptional regulator [Paenibacillus sp. NPDC057967]|uniref:LuxR C-terminal-related transcriptional regulator n=1 Tax=Paenibacillus sp. NPDC057967 TaxID=3346293 RepID=UPI0036D7E94B